VGVFIRGAIGGHRDAGHSRVRAREVDSSRTPIFDDLLSLRPSYFSFFSFLARDDAFVVGHCKGPPTSAEKSRFTSDPGAALRHEQEREQQQLLLAFGNA
jgi:hypothetical protein